MRLTIQKIASLVMFTCMALTIVTAFISCNETDPAFIDISSQDILFEAESSLETVEILSNTLWTIDCAEEWCSTSITEGRHRGEVGIKVLGNTSIEERTAVITVNYGEGSTTINVRQKGAEARIDISEDNLTFYRNAEETNLVIACNGDWNTVSSKEWCTVSPATGSGDAVVKIAVSDNNTQETRQATLTVTMKKSDGTSIIQTIGVEQKATKAMLIVTPKEKTLTAVAETFTVNVLSNIEWNVVKDSPWFTVDKTSSSGDDEIIVTVADNDTGQQRVGNISISTGSAYEEREVHTVTIIQSSDEYFLEVPVTGYYLTEAASELNIHYQIGGVNCRANAETSATWLTLEGIGDGVIKYSVSRNEGSEPRSADITVYTSGQAGAPMSRIVTVVQSSTDYILDIFFSDYILDPDGETIEIEPIVSIPDLELLSNASWCNVSYVQATNKITLGADINLSGSTRVAKVIVSLVVPATGDRLTKEFSVTQDNSNHIFELTQTNIELPGTGGVGTSQLNASGSWNISNRNDIPSWLTLSPQSGTGTTGIIVSAKESLSTLPRTFTAVFTDEKTGVETSLVVIQLPSETLLNRYVGRGYDATGQYANDNSVKAQLLDWDGLVNAGLVADMVTLNDMNEVSYHGENSVSYQEKLTNSVNVGGNLKLFNLQVSSTSSTEINTSRETEMGMFKHMTRDKALFIYSHIQAYELRDYLTVEAKQEIDNMDISTLISKYGTHLLTGAVTGGSLEYTMTADRKATAKQESWELAIKGGFGKEKVGKAEAGKNYETFKKVEENSSNFSERLVVRGGDPQYASGLGSQSAYDNWLASMTDKSKLVLVDFYGSKLLPIWEFASTSQRQNAIREAVEQYIRDTEIILQNTHKRLIVTFYGVKRSSTTGTPYVNLDISGSIIGDESFKLERERMNMGSGTFVFEPPMVKEFSLNKNDEHELQIRLTGDVDFAGGNNTFDRTFSYFYNPAMSTELWYNSSNNTAVNMNITGFEGNNHLRFYDNSDYTCYVGFQWLDNE